MKKGFSLIELLAVIVLLHIDKELEDYIIDIIDASRNQKIMV